jgi:hypothetical protein
MECGIEHGLPWVKKETNSMKCDIQPGSIAVVCSTPKTYLIYILFDYQLQLDFLEFPWYLQANAVPATARVPRTLFSNLYPLIILYALSVLYGVNIPCSNSFINDRNTARCEILLAVLIKIRSSGCRVFSTDK